MRPSGVAALAVTVVGVAAQAAAPTDAQCKDFTTAAAVVRCAMARSPEVRRARLDLDVVAGQRTTAASRLPARPVLSVSGGHRWGEGQTAFDAYLTLAQELEIGGQRGARLDELDAVAAAAVRRLAAAEHEIAAEAEAAVWRLAAARQRTRLARESARVAADLAHLADERRKEALVAPVDADIAASEAVQLAVRAAEVERLEGETAAALATLLDEEEPGQLADDLPVPTDTEIPTDLVARALLVRGDLAAAHTEKVAAERRAAVLERERVPNVTVSLSVQRDGFAENFVGVGLSVPIPVAVNGAGGIAAARARAAQTESDVAAVRRRVALEVKRAVAAERAARTALRAFPAALLGRARTDLEALADALTARRMSVREALLAQRSLLELLAAHLEARLAYALARTELGRAAGGAP